MNASIPRSRWPVLLIGLTGLLALTAIVLEIVVLKTSRRPAEVVLGQPREPEPSPAPVPQADAEKRPAAVPAAPAPPTLKPRAESPARKDKPLPDPPPAAPVPLTAKPKTTSDDAKSDSPPSQEMLLEALGGLSAAHLYQSYLNIGLLADGVEGEVYSRADARKVLATVTGLMDTVDKQLARLPEEKLKKDERAALLRIRSLTTLLRTQIEELQAYWESGDKNHAKRFHKLREEAWAGIKELLDFKD